MLSAAYSISVRLSVRPSQAGIVSKRMNVGWCRIHWQVANWLYIVFGNIRLINIFTKTHPLTRALNETGSWSKRRVLNFWPISLRSSETLQDTAEVTIKLPLIGSHIMPFRSVPNSMTLSNLESAYASLRIFRDIFVNFPSSPRGAHMSIQSATKMLPIKSSFREKQPETPGHRNAGVTYSQKNSHLFLKLQWHPYNWPLFWN